VATYHIECGGGSFRRRHFLLARFALAMRSLCRFAAPRFRRVR